MQRETWQCLYDLVTWQGGTLYETATESGFLSAYAYMHKWKYEKQQEKLKFVRIVTACYVQPEDSGEMERIFLWFDVERAEKRIDAEMAEVLLRRLSVQREGRRIVMETDLKLLGYAGYFCLYERQENGHNGKTFARYQQAFGEQKKMLDFSGLTEKGTFWGDGWNQALWVCSSEEEVLVMPDLYAMELAVRIFYLERMIRKNADYRFFADRIPDGDERVSAGLDKLLKELFLENWQSGYQEKTLPRIYQRLVYQICYMRQHYEDIFRQMWEQPFFLDDNPRKRHDIIFSPDDIWQAAQKYVSDSKFVLAEGQRLLVFCLNDTDCEAGIFEKKAEALVCLTRAREAYTEELMEGVDERIRKQMKKLAEQELSILQIEETDEKNKRVFLSFYAQLGYVQRQLIRSDKAVFGFDNGVMQIEWEMERKEYKECMIPFYDMLTGMVGKLQKKCGADKISAICLAGTRGEDISLWEYLEEQYQSPVYLRAEEKKENAGRDR